MPAVLVVIAILLALDIVTQVAATGRRLEQTAAIAVTTVLLRGGLLVWLLVVFL